MADQQLAKVVVLGDDALAHDLATTLTLPLCGSPPDQGYYFHYNDKGLELCPADAATGRIRVDFVSGKHRHRRLYGGGKGQQIAKAIGVQGKVKPTVLNVTAGLGGDGFVLASLGCQVYLVERHPVVRALLQDGLQRLANTSGLDSGLNSGLNSELHELALRLQLMAGDGLDVIAQWCLPEPPQVIYLDPMFPDSKKTAQVKKEMAAFRQIVGDDQDASKLLAPAYELASHRVVVKRPRLAPCLAGRPPTFVLTGKANRFDIYVKAAFSGTTA